MNYELSPEDYLAFKLCTLDFKVERLRLKYDDPVIVDTKSGKVKGAKRRSIYNDDFYSFEHIPYAQPPIGELRFRAPVAVQPWKEVRDCTHYGPKPMQFLVGDKIIGGSEDCLHLNVYTNNLKPAKPRPVMVWIHGGAFVFGEATPEWYGPDNFIKKDVILVTIQYRLGALGFFGLNDPNLAAPGNCGLKDQIMALKWVKANCASFGGDPEAITLFGESAGGASVHLLMASNATKGLFHRAIAQSGVATADWSTVDVRGSAFPLAEAAGYTGAANNERAILEYLQNCSAEEILEAEAKCALAGGKKVEVKIMFGPTVEPYESSDTVLAKPPKELLRNSWSNSIPLLIGGNSCEGLMFLPFVNRFPKMVDLALETCTSHVPKDVAATVNESQLTEKGLQLRKLHTNNEKPTKEHLFDILSFSYFWHPIQKTIRSRLTDAPKAGTFLYRFDFDSNKMGDPFRLIRWGRGVSGVAHADELSYLFTNSMTRRMDPKSREYRTVQRIVGIWTAFATNGNPNDAGIDGLEGIHWSPLSSGDTAWKCLNISDDLRFIDLPEMDKLKVWHEL